MAGKKASNPQRFVSSEAVTPVVAAAAVKAAVPCNAQKELSKTRKEDSAKMAKRALSEQRAARALVAAPSDRDADPTARIEHDQQPARKRKHDL